MPKFTFIGEHTDIYGKPDGTKITYEFDVDTLDNVMEHFDLFVRGCGYMPPPGTLDYVVDDFIDFAGGSTMEDSPEWQNEEFVTPQDDMAEWDKVHSTYYFDTERNK
jgi:hypothetical protein